jgi:hypothetical protein
VHKQQQQQQQQPHFPATKSEIPKLTSKFKQQNKTKQNKTKQQPRWLPINSGPLCMLASGSPTDLMTL